MVLSHDSGASRRNAGCWIFSGKLSAVCFCLAFVVGLCTSAVGAPLIVSDGDARASIVIAEEPPRTVPLAARELQAHIEKMSGAVLPIGTAPDPNLPVTIYIGQSAFTDAQGITDDGLYHGAFRIVSGPDWLVLLGRDRDFTPIEPWPRHRRDHPETQAAWEEIYGGPCENPMNYNCGPRVGFNESAGIWRYDEGGSLQAVYALLRDWGVRWFMPGELGEVVPTARTLALPTMDRTVHPDFFIRYPYWGQRFPRVPLEDVLWWLRLGFNDGSSVLGVGMPSHGMRLITGNAYMRENHPEYYALYGGVRATTGRAGHACFTSEGLQRETVRYLRAVFDHFGEPAMDLWPEDGYLHCHCELCEGKSHADVVFGFLDRVARELYETHPDRLITSGAYASFKDPPDSITRFSPNVAVYLANCGRPGLVHDDEWEPYWAQVEAWREKLAPGNLIRVENMLFGPRRLVVHPRAIARDLKALKGISSMGEYGEIPWPRGGEPATQWRTPGVNHLNYYVQSRFLWDADQDVDALLEDYYTNFYGPAAEAMQAAFDYVEANYARRGRSHLPPEHQLQLIDMLAQAREIAGETRYGERIAVIQAELRSREQLQAELQAIRDAFAQRQNAPLVTGQRLPASEPQPVYQLRALPDGAEPDMETTFTVGWDAGTLVFDITCHEPEMDTLFVTENVWGGDSVAILIETPYHSYYQIEINPDGVVFDADREFRVDANWNSLATVDARRGDDYWRLTVRLPIMSVAEGAGDPNNNIFGDKPTPDAPWFFNVGRSRRRGARGAERTGYTFSPTGRGSFHVKERFARLVIE